MMLRPQFDPRISYSYVRYGRMSDPRQNPTSPDQQFDNIQRALHRCGNTHWKHVADYRDDGESGLYIRKRLGYQKMLFDIKSGSIAIDLILVDDIARFGRHKRLPQVRHDLYNKHGILILDANSGFADPLGPQGRIYGTIEELRATEEGHTKASHVLRGKRDAVLQRRWPGGPPPFGFELEFRLEDRGGRPKQYSVLVPNPETNWIIERAFCLADQNGWGQELLARCLTQDNEIPDEHKPFEPATVGSWMENEIYMGVMVWPKVATDVIDDCRAVEQVPAEEQERVEDYCEPIVAPELFSRVYRVRKQRGEARKAALTKSDDKHEKQLKAPVPGMTLNYLLTGLVRCGHCNRAMVPNGSGVYTTIDGEKRRYVGYHCPAYRSGICPNGKRIPEQWLREMVVNTIRDRLFPST